MVDTIDDDVLNEIYDRKQTRMVSDTDKKDDGAITEWLTRGTPGKATANTKRLAKALAKPDIIKDEIEDIEFKKTVNEEKQLSPIEKNIETIKISSAKKEVRELVKDKKSELRQERLISKGKATTFFRNQLKQAKSEEQISDILSEAEESLGEGKNLQSLKAGAEVIREGFE